VRRRPHDPFGGLQVVFIGDLFQLPPVVKSHEWQVMAENYRSPFFFDAQVLKESNPICIELKKIYRQSDNEFIALLNNIRNNSATPEDLELLHLHYDPSFVPYRDEGYITLTSHNYQADNINKEELHKLPSITHKIEAIIEKDFPENAYPIERTLFIKEGAQIMFVKNDKGELRRYFNGKIGTVEKIEDEDEKIWIRFHNEPNLLLLEKETWKNIRYKYDNNNDEINEEVLGTFTQYPIRLAWAVTIHKSQGLTFDKAIVDAGQSFAPGQVYVALSRLTSLQGLILRSRITPQSISTDHTVLEFTEKALPEVKVDEILQRSQKDFLNESLLKAFFWDKLTEAALDNASSYNQRSIPDVEAAAQWGSALLQVIEQEQQTANKFLGQLATLVHGSNLQLLHERATAAVTWFVQHLNTYVIESLQEHISTMSIKQRTKKYIRELQDILLIAERKKIQLLQVVAITKGLHESVSLDVLMNEVSQIHAPKLPESFTPEVNEVKLKPTIGNSRRISLEMFLAGDSIKEIAAKRSYAESTIHGHLADCILTGELQATQLISEERLNTLKEVIQNMPNASWAEIQNIAGAEYTYREIRVAVNYCKRLQELDKPVQN
jgi:hypothetical protein